MRKALDFGHFRNNVAAVVLLVIAGTGPVAAQEIVVPSGQSVTLFDVVLEPQTDSARFRFLAPAIGPEGGARPFEQVQGDFQWLCDQAALPALATNDWHVGHVVISMSDREVPFGSTDPDVVQYFEGFRIDAGTCIWEIF